MKRDPGRYWTLACLALSGIVMVPILAITCSLAQDSEGVWSHLAETVLGKYVSNTLLLAAGVGCGTLLVGVTTAWLVTAFSFPGVGVFRWALLLPLAIPSYLLAYAMTDLLQFSGPVQAWLRDSTGWGREDYWFPQVRSLGGAVVILVLCLYPYVYLAASNGFLGLSASVIEASRTLGAGPWARFSRVVLPLARPSIFAGVALVVMETMAEFGAVDYCAVDTFSTGIYRTWMGRGSLTAAAQLSTCLLGAVGLLYLLESGFRKSAKFHHATQRTRPPAPVVLSGAWRWVAFLACAAPVLGGFLVPVARFIQLTIEGGDSRTGELFAQLAGNSVLVAGAASLSVVALGLFLAHHRRESPSTANRFAVRVAGLGYAIPGGVIAIGVLGPLWWFESGVNEFTERVLGWSPGLFLSGTIFAVLFGYQVRFLAIPLNVVGAGFERIRSSIDDAAKTLGASRLRLLWSVHLPLLRGSLVCAALMVFVDVLKELPATLILRPFNFDTLAVRVYQLASDERLSEASTGALAIILAGLIPVVLLTRMLKSSYVIPSTSGGGAGT